jgi:hypothetical protein
VIDRLDAAGGEDPLHRRSVANVGPMKDEVPARECLDSAQRLLVAVAQIVHDGDVVAGSKQLEAGVAPYETGATGDENGHGRHEVKEKRDSVRAGVALLPSSAPRRNRTYNLVIKSHLLCQLS